MFLLNVIKVFLLQAFFVSYVYARYPFISSQFIKYKEEFPQACGSFTWIPLSPAKNNCDKTSNPFRSHPGINSTVDALDDPIGLCNREIKKKFPTKLDPYINNIYINGEFDAQTVHDVIAFCLARIVCDTDLRSEVNLDIVWGQITTKSTEPNECDGKFEVINPRVSDCLFLSRFDIQYYFSQLDKLQQTLSDGGLCVDRYGRKYPPPVGLGGKCVMFQYVKNGNETPEVFMPIERQDLIKRIYAFDISHEIRKNSTTFDRLLPKNYTAVKDVADCMTLNINKQSFVHCMYDPKDSHMFYPANESYYFCPKNYNVKQSFIQNEAKKELLNFDNAPLYINYAISNESFVISEHCYISTGFSPNGTVDGKTNITYHVELLGSEACSSITETQQNGTYYQERINESIENYCPWENDTTYPLCFETKSEHHFSSYVETLNYISDILNFSPCYYQVNSGNDCYYSIDFETGAKSRISPKWIQDIENGNLNATKKDFKSTIGCGTVFITKEMKKPCYEKSPREEYSKGSNIIICKCNTSLCDEPGVVDPANFTEYKNEFVCNQGLDETSLASPSFFCSVRLTIVTENEMDVKIFNYSALNPYDKYEKDPFIECWNSTTLSEKLRSKVPRKDITSCFHKDNEESETYECCCFTSNISCNTEKLIEDYRNLVIREKIGNINQERGCAFKNSSTITTTETCDKGFVMNSEEMKCYGVFKIPITSINNHAKPTLETENCYWPHPQYHDKYSVFCSNQFFNATDLVENKCLSLFINDFTSNSMERTLILCCKTAEYPKERELILSRSFILW
uniref:Uncharacterized protein n=1 Tax=Panagrolaimus davidi TaxID=227884 RepID=A0A914P745_9BILA